MKITIELEIQPNEVGLAAELLSTLRTLTDHVKVVMSGSGTVAIDATVNAGALGTLPAPSAAAAVANGTVGYQAAKLGSAPPQQPAPFVPATPAAPAAATAPAPPAPAAPAPPPPGKPQAFHLIVPRLGNAETHDQAVADVIATLHSAGTDKLVTAVDDLVGAFEQNVFDNPEILTSATGVMPYMLLYGRLSGDLQSKVRDRMVSKILTTLARKRAPSITDRAPFFAYADAFATLVKFDAVPMEGAVQTLSRLLMKPETRCAGVTMLGKTVEYCGEQLLRVPEAHLAALWRALNSVKEDAFQYDLKFINQTLDDLIPPGAQRPGMTPPGGAPAAAPAVSFGGAGPVGGVTPGSTPTALAHVGCYSGHQATVFTLCYDAAHMQLISGGHDGQLLVWGQDGTPVSRFDVSSHYICSIDILPRSGTLVTAAVPVAHGQDPGHEPPCILAFTPPADTAPGAPRLGPWTPRGRMYGPNRGLISFVLALGGDGDVIAMGENTAAGANGQLPPGRDLVCLYDVSRGPPLEQMTPLTVYAEHTDMVTCAAPWHANPNVFVSGAQDGVMLVWDRRTSQSVGSFGALDAAKGRVVAHQEMVTCLDTTDNLLLSTSMDKTLSVWDFRQLSMTHGSAYGALVKLQIDGQPTLKVAVTGAPHSRLAAISTYQGLYVMDFTNMTAPATLIAPPLSDGRPFKYFHDIRWAGGAGGPGQPLLFGASDDPRIDVFALSFA